MFNRPIPPSASFNQDEADELRAKIEGLAVEIRAIVGNEIKDRWQQAAENILKDAFDDFDLNVRFKDMDKLRSIFQWMSEWLVIYPKRLWELRNPQDAQLSATK